MATSERTKILWDFRQHAEISAILLSIFTLTQAVALITFRADAIDSNILGLYGHISAALWYILLGPISFLGIIALAFLSYSLYIKDFSVFSTRRLLGLSGALASLALLLVLIQTLTPQTVLSWRIWLGVSVDYAWLYRLGGLPMDILYIGLPYINLSTLFNVIGTALFASTGLFVSLLCFFNVEISWISSLVKKKSSKPQPLKTAEETSPLAKKESLQSIHIAAVPCIEKTTYTPPIPREELKAAPRKNRTELTLSSPSSLSSYQLPPSDLLHIPEEIDLSDVKSELKDKAKLLEDTLMSFGIEAKVGQIHCGPRITLFEVHPAIGVKVGKILTLEHDLALNMKAKSIRIIAPIPGKAAVGIEIPNIKSQEVSFHELLSTYQKQGSPYKIPMLLGKAVNGDPVIADLTKMPHCIIAGATGSGKSVCINSIIMSILMLAKPDEIRLLMVDPKKVELTPYSTLPHMIAPVITDTYDAAQSLTWLVREMEYRYEVLKLTGQRNIESFNKRQINVTAEKEAPLPIPEKLFYIVGIIDELADLMMASTQDIETPITRIAQMARAVGIHLILATQRPSREVITGLIKANFPSRISFKVASRINSQIILDDVGAETLLGNGDMLILLPGLSNVIRAQGAFVRDEEIHSVVEQITKTAPTNYLIKSFTKVEKDLDESDEPFDALFDEAKNIVFSTGNASTTFLQRKLKIGYARAASIMDQLENQGIIGPQEGSRPRKIFYPKSAQEALDPADELAPPEETPLLQDLSETDSKDLLLS